MNSKKVSKKEVKQKVLTKIEGALTEFKTSVKSKKFAKKLKKASSSLADFIVNHDRTPVGKKASKSKVKSKKAVPKKTAKVNPA